MKRYLLIIIALFLLAGAITATVWWIAPSTPIKGLEDEKIASIEVFCGDTGTSFTVTDAETVDRILLGVTDTTLRKRGLSGREDGFSFLLTFMRADGESVGSLIIDSNDTLICGKFRYRSSKPLPTDILGQLAEAAE